VKIFWIKQGPLLPLDTGGKIRTWNLLKELAKQDQLTVLSFFPSHVPVSHNGAERLFTRLISMPVAMPKKYSLGYRLDYLRKLPSPVPYVVRQYGIPQVRERVREVLGQENFDVVLCDFLFPCLNLPDQLPCPQVLFAHNAETMIWKRHFEVTRNPVWKLVTGLEYYKMRRFESLRSRVFDHVIAVSEVDRDFFAEHVPSAQLSVLATGVDLEYFRPSEALENPHKLVFTGSMDWLANEDAILYFAHKILPLMFPSAPELTLTVAGRDPTEKLRQLARTDPRIRLTGTVSDVRPYTAEAAVYVLPLQVGSGTRLKVFEAMAMGKAIVSTRVGVEGLPVVSGEHLLIADEPDEFAAAVLRLLKDIPLRRRLGRAARSLVENGFGWPQVAQSFHAMLERVSETSRKSAARGIPAEAPEHIPTR
jgi:glycosyltransferase involved in cell wall biosynthesis